MEQNKKENPLSRLIELIGDKKPLYVVSVLLAVLGVASGIVPYFAVGRMIVSLMEGEREISFYTGWCLIAAAGYLFKVLLSAVAKMLLALLTQMATRWMPGGMMGYYFFVSTKVNEFTLAMYRMHLPGAFVVPFSVMFRFFPAVREEWIAIKNAMKMRGISNDILKAPMTALDYRLVPLMVSVTTIGNDLSVAAITRGLGDPAKRTSIGRVGFGFADRLLILLATGIMIAYILRIGGAL